MKYALDANTLSYFFRGEGHVGQRLRLVRPADIGIPAPVLHESRYGILRLGSSARRGRRPRCWLRLLIEITARAVRGDR